jgi:putative nucleotidyltransferase with HDIG domain
MLCPFGSHLVKAFRTSSVSFTHADRQEALQLVDHYISSADKRKHVIAVSAIMKSLAEAIGANEDEWEPVGLMHDLDYDLVKGDMRRHRLVAAEMLEGKL